MLFAGRFMAATDEDSNVLALATDPSNEMLITGDSNGHITVWDISSYCISRAESIIAQVSWSFFLLAFRHQCFSHPILKVGNCLVMHCMVREESLNRFWRAVKRVLPNYKKLKQSMSSMQSRWQSQDRKKFHSWRYINHFFASINK